MRPVRAVGRGTTFNWVWATMLSLVIVGGGRDVAGQEEPLIKVARGDRVAPIYEGFLQNADGTHDLVFGYFNLNTDEVVDLPIGPNNQIEPGGPDQGQPTRFFPRRSRFVFRVRVPSDFGNKEVVWTLTRNGKTEKAYATLKPDYVIDERIMMMNSGGFGGRGQRLGEADNTPPTLRVEGEKRRTVTTKDALTLTAFMSDDGYPRGGLGGSNDLGLGAGWFVYRGTGTVTFEPEQVNPEFRIRRARFRARDDSGRLTDELGRTPEQAARDEASAANGGTKRMPAATASAAPARRMLTPPPPAPVKDRPVPVTARFSEPGTYVLRVMAHDGGLAATQDVTVTVLPAPP